MKPLLFILTLLVGLSFQQSTALSQISPQVQIKDCENTKQLTLDQIKERVRIYVTVTNDENRAAIDKGIATEIAGIGVRGFQPNESILNDLRKLGAGPQTIQSLVDEDAKNRRKTESQTRAGNTSDRASRLAVGPFTVNGEAEKLSWAGESTSSFLTIQLQKVAKTISVIDYQFADLTLSAGPGPDYLNGYLNVDHIVYGNLELRDNRNRLNLFITRVSDKKIQYSETFTTPKNGPDAIVDLQQQATLEVMRALKGGFTLMDTLERTHLLPTSSLRSYEHYAKAVELTNQYQKSLSKGDNDYSIELRSRATKEYEKSIEIDPSFTWPLFNLAVLYSSILDHDQAIQLLRRVLTIDSDFNEARLRLAYILFEESIFTTDEDKAKGAALLVEALKEIKIVKARHADQVDALILEGKIYQHLGQLNDAILTLENAVNKSPCYSNARTRLASVYIDARRTGDAKTQLEKAVEIDQNNARANFMLGRLLGKEKNYPEAIKRYEKSAPNGFEDYGVDDSFLTYTIGRAYLDIGDLRKAMMHYLPLFQMNPGLSSQAKQDLGEFLKNNPQKLESADEDTRKALIFLRLIKPTPNK